MSCYCYPGPFSLGPLRNWEWYCRLYQTDGIRHPGGGEYLSERI